MRCIGFAPFVRPDSEILILGSFPSVKSREINFYYGHAQNRFWHTLAAIYGERTPGSTEDKMALLVRRRLALWDIVTECEITGSMDADIKNPKIADVPALFAATPLKKILTNGAKAHSLLIKNHPCLADISVRMPSTSPANARFDFSVWKEELLSERL